MCWNRIGLRIGLAECKPTPPPSALDIIAKQQKAKVEKHVIDVGDMEVSLRLQLRLIPEMIPQNVTEDFLKDNDILRLDTVSIHSPAPNKLLAKCTLEPVRPVSAAAAVRVTILRDNVELAKFGYVIETSGLQEALQHEVDVLSDLSSLPESLLVMAQAEIILLPDGMDTALLDPLTVTAAPENLGSLLSNPMRINIVK